MASFAEHAFNNSQHSVTKLTPVKMLYGRDTDLNLDLEAEAPEGEAPEATERLRALQDAREKA